ncbi:MAG: protein kinase [Planctomycetia bacterium]|nr:protein kinase [Planctomycetia bacterium]
MVILGEKLGQYRLDAKIGEGGMGVVYRARDEELNRDVAVKVLAAGMLEQLGKDHLLREAQTASALSHPNICTIYQVGRVDDGFYFVMELVEGQPLSELARASQLTTEAVTRYGVQIADALAHAHDRQIVHRDLKGANVVITKEGRVKVLDFGLARRLDSETVDAVTRMQASVERDRAIVGTLAYMAPEVLRGEGGGYPADIWALGILLYEAATGHLPFAGNTAYELCASILQQAPTSLPSSVPPSLTAAIMRCLTKDVKDRFQRASEVRSTLATIQSAAIVSEPRRDEPSGPRTLVLRGIQHLDVKNGDVLLLVGTTKGAFLLRSGRDRKQWQVAGPYFHGHAIYSLSYDGRNGRHRLWASTGSVLWGTYLRSSDDFGKTWTNPLEANIKFPPESGVSLKNIWKIALGPPGAQDTLYCGVEPAALFESHDTGETWSLVRGLFDHPHRPRWMPGQGGLCLHTILPHPTQPGRMHIAISAAGVYQTDDAGQSWQARNRGIRVTFMPERFPEFGQCVHKIVRHPDRPDRLFLQNHWGLYRSDDGAESWTDIAHSVPSDFGFAMAVHPHDPDCVYIVPMESDEFRCSPEGRLRVYRTRNAGGSWEALTRGLPQQSAYETVLRDGMVTDSLDPAGIYFGTRSGKLYASRDAGQSWKEIVNGLPQIVCVTSAVVAELPGSPSVPTPPLKRKRASPRKVPRRKAPSKRTTKFRVAKRKSPRARRQKRSRR